MRTLRKERGLSLEQLSAKSGVALATLSRIENGKNTGTFRTHQKLAEAFALSLPELYRNLHLETPDATEMAPHAEEAETFTYDDKASAVLLTRRVSGRQMLPQMLILRPGGKTSLEEYKPGTERWAFGLEGVVDVIVGEKEHRLTPGATLYFRASLPHRFHNKSDKPAKLISVTSPAVL